MQYFADLRTGLQPLSDFQRPVLCFFQADMQCAQTAQHKEAILSPGQHRHLVIGFAQFRPPLCIGGNQPHQYI